MNKGLETSA